MWKNDNFRQNISDKSVTLLGTYREPFKNLIGKHNDALPHSLKISNASSKVEIKEEEKVMMRSLIHNTLGVEGHVRASECGL
jgi:hypothetical protein